GVAGGPAHADPVVTGITISSLALVAYNLLMEQELVPDSDHVALEVGRFDPIKAEDQANYFSVGYRPAFWIWKAQPFVGVGGTDDKSAFAYAGLRLEVHFGDFTVTPSFALAGYAKGDGKNLGSPVVGRSGLDFEYKLPNNLRLGVAFHHMSHGDLAGSLNPG